MKVVEQWRPKNDKLCVLYLDEGISLYKPYRAYRIDGKIYKPVPMSHIKDGQKVIAIEGEGNFIGKEVEFVNEA